MYVQRKEKVVRMRVKEERRVKEKVVRMWTCLGACSHKTMSLTVRCVCVCVCVVLLWGSNVLMIL